MHRPVVFGQKSPEGIDKKSPSGLCESSSLQASAENSPPRPKAKSKKEELKLGGG